MEDRKIVIRRAELLDAPGVARLGNDVLGWKASLEEVRERLAYQLDNPDDYGFFVAEVDGEIMGFANVILKIEMKVGKQARIDWVVTDENARGLGLGRKVMEATEKWAKEHGSTTLKLVSGAHRTETHKFYEKIGYEKAKEQYQFKKQLVS